MKSNNYSSAYYDDWMKVLEKVTGIPIIPYYPGVEPEVPMKLLFSLTKLVVHPPPLINVAIP